MQEVGQKVRVEVTYVLEYELPYWDKDRHEAYYTTDPQECVDIDIKQLEETATENASSALGYDWSDAVVSVKAEGQIL